MTNPTGGSFGHGFVRFVSVYEGDATRTDVVTPSGYTEDGVRYAAQIPKTDIEDGIAYVKNYSSWEDSVQLIGDGDNGNLIVGRLTSINNDWNTLGSLTQFIDKMHSNRTRPNHNNCPGITRNLYA